MQEKPPPDSSRPSLSLAEAPAKPLVSVVVPVYNQGEFVEHAIASILAQEYSPVEIIVVNDGSTDDTRQRLEPFEHAARIFHQANAGASAALNRGIQESHGELVCWLSADDEFLAGKLEQQVAALTSHPEAAFSHTGYEVIDGAGARLSAVTTPVAIHPDPFVTVFWANSLNGSTVMVRREVIEGLGGFDESLRADVDADMWMKILSRSTAVVVPGLFVRYRVHDNSLSANTDLMVRSMNLVRNRHLAELIRRVKAGPEPAATLAKISGYVARQGLFYIARRLCRESVRTGFAPREQVAAVVADVVTRMRARPRLRRIARGVKSVGRRIRIPTAG
jgi:teichuronic acid biosynthesis glycosyltransferase TuaG